MSNETPQNVYASLERTNPRWWRQYAFHLGIGVFIISTSFLYGLSAGLMKKGGLAFANTAFHAVPSIAPVLAGKSFAHLEIPAAVFVAPLGNNVRINNRPAEVVSFFTDRSVEELTNEQMQVWRAAGRTVIGKATKRRGFAVAFDTLGGERYSLSIWSVPPQLRGSLSEGHAVQGMLAYVDMRNSNSVSQAENILDVPLRDGGQSGAVFSSEDAEGRTYSGVYTVPGSVLENIHYYRNEMSNAGWHEMDGVLGQPGRAEFEVGNLLFQRDEQQIVLLFSPVQRDADSQESGDIEKTVIAITEGSLALSGR